MIVQLDHAKLRDRVLVLAGEILGERERRVFRARCMGSNEAVEPVDSLAAELGVTRERVYQLELSARRKIGVALARVGLNEAGPGGIELPKSRARRRREPMDMAAAKR